MVPWCKNIRKLQECQQKTPLQTHIKGRRLDHQMKHPESCLTFASPVCHNPQPYRPSSINKHQPVESSSCQFWTTNAPQHPHSFQQLPSMKLPKIPEKFCRALNWIPLALFRMENQKKTIEQSKTCMQPARQPCPYRIQSYIQNLLWHTLAQNCHCEFWCGMHLTCKNTPIIPDRNGLVTRLEKESKRIRLQSSS
jgi:hypothetical protein